LWDSNPGAMRVALARHDTVVRATIQSHGGVVFKTMGDAFCAVFSTASAAISAALAAQCGFSNVDRGGLMVDRGEGRDPSHQPSASNHPAVLRVRIAVHTGEAEVRDGDYFGPALNRIARLLAVGHGGQVLLSAATQELVRDDLPPAVRLIDLGAHRLRDLARPEQVFQLCHPDLPAEFPPLRSLDNPELPNNLPQQATSFVGRDREIEEVKALLGKARLLTLTGSGGCGKTRLALQVGADLLGEYPEGVWLVELASLAEPALVPQAVAAVLGVKEEAG